MNHSHPLRSRLIPKLRAAGRALPSALLAAALAAGPALAIRPEDNTLPSPHAGIASHPQGKAIRHLRKMRMEDLLGKGEGLRQSRLPLQGDPSAQILQKLNARLKAGGGEARIRLDQKDPLGNRHLRIQLFHDGYPVVGAEAVVHINAGNEVYAVTGSLADGLPAAAAPRLKAQEAFDSAKSGLKRKDAAREKQAPRLVIFDGALAYETWVEEPGNTPHLWRSYVDAASGALLFREDRVLHAAPVGGAEHDVSGSLLAGEGGNVATIKGWLDNNNLYFLRNNNALWGVYDQIKSDWSQNATGNWGTTDRAAVSLARNLELTQKYVSQVELRDSYDNAGAFANAYVHEGTNYVNAYWDGSGFHFGDGDGIEADPLTVLDVAAHEYGHAITQYTSNLDYSYESGALNESFSDIHGALVEFWAQPDGRSAYPAGQDGHSDWLMGEDCWLSGDALRDMRNPQRFGQPSYYQGTDWYTGSGDGGGVHTNSGVQNFAFYLLSEGGTGSNDGHPYSISGIGFEHAGQIAMYANMFLLTSAAQYSDTREAWILAASTLGYDVQTVKDVWTACGVLEQVNNLDVSPSAIAFGNVGAGSTEMLFVNLVNGGAKPTTVTGLSFDNSAFSTGKNPPITVPGGGSFALPISFTPPAQGSQTGILTIASNADDHPVLTVSLSGTGTAPAAIAVSPTSISESAPVGDVRTVTVHVTNTGVADLRVTPHAKEGAALASQASGGRKVLLLAAFTSSAAFADTLRGLPNVESVTIWDGSVSTPVLADLKPYDAVIVASNTSWASPSGIGNALADFVDGGGAVILMGATFHAGGGWTLQGRILDPGYAPLAVMPYTISSASLASLVSHPINQGVTALTTGLYANSTLPQGTGVSLGTYTGGYLIGAYNPDKPIVSLNAYPETGYFGGDLLVQVGNALDFAAKGIWLSVADEGQSVSVAQGQSYDFIVTLDAAKIQGGSYSGSIEFAHNDPAQPNPLTIPVAFAVDGFRRLAVSPPTLDFGNRQVGSAALLSVTLSNGGDEATAISDLSINGSPDFSIDGTPPAVIPGGQSATVQIRFQPSALGVRSATLSIASDAEDNPAFAIPVSGAGTPAPALTLTPPSIQASVAAGASTSRTLTVGNAGGADLDFAIEGADGRILINEFSNEPDFIELWNQGGDKDIGGWSLAWADNAGSEAHGFTFPAGYVLHSGRRVVVREFTGVANDSTFYAGANIGWVQGSIVSVALTDAAGNGIDFVRTTGSTSVPPAGTAWNAGGVDFSGYTAYRTQNADADGPEGWASGTLPSEFQLNPGQTAAAAFPAWLTLSPAAGTVGPGLSQDVTLTLNSAGLFGGTYPAALHVKSNDPTSPADGAAVPVELTVVGQRRLSAPASLPFGNVWAGAQAVLSLSLQNAGNEATTVTAIASDNPDFRTTTALPLTVPPFGTASVEVVFAPVAPGNEAGNLTLTSNAGDNPTLVVAVSGSGTSAPQLEASPGSFTKTLAAGDTSTEYLTLSNPGGDNVQWSIRYAPATGSLAAQAVRDRHQAHLLPAAPPILSPNSGPSDGSRPDSTIRSSASKGAATAVPQAGAWNPLSPMAAVRAQFGLAASGNGKIYAFGGWDGSNYSSTLETYDIAAKGWSAPVAIPIADRGFASAAGADGRIYVIGGLVNDSYRFDPPSGAWTPIAAPPVPAVWEAAATAGEDGRIYVFGGEYSGATNAVQIYDPATDTWSQGAPMPSARLGLRAARLPGGLILVAGGVDASLNPTNEADIYDPATNTWSAAAPLPVAKTHFGMTVGDDGRVYAVGGKQSYYNNSGPFLDEVDAYDPLSGTWKIADPLPAAMGELGAAASLGQVFAGGGANGIVSSAFNALGVSGTVTPAPANGTLAAGASVQVAVFFDSRSRLGGVYTGNLEITHNAPAQANPLAIPVTLTVQGTRRLSASVSSLDFGNAWVGTTVTRKFTLENSGNEATTVTGLASDNAEFSLAAALPVTVPAFGSLEIETAFTPADPGAETGNLAITSDAEDHPSLSVALLGTGTAPPSASLEPAAFSLSLAPTDAPADRTATLSNSGGDNLSWRIASVTQTGSPLQAATTALPAALPPLRADLIYSEANYSHPYVPGRVIVGFKTGKTDFAASAGIATLGIRDMRELAGAVNPATHRKANPGRKLVLLRIQAADGVRHAIDVLRQDANVAFAEPDYIQKAVAIPDDPSFGLLYGMNNTGQSGGVADADIDAPEAWDRHTGNRSILIGIIDTGIDYTHPDLAANIWTNPGEIAGNGLDDDGNGFIDDVHGWDFAYDDDDPMDGHYHGTHCAGTIAGAGNNGVGVAGVMWTASLVALKFLDDSGSGSTSDAVDAVNYANAMGIRITSNSWGGGGFSQALEDVIAAGGLFIAAAGNSGSDNDVSPQYPASYPLDNIISVAATDNADALASFSCYGLTTVDLGAPGVNIYSAAPGNGYQYLSGTSMATPHVSGAAGLVWTYNPTLTAAQVKAALLASVDPDPALAGKTASGGRLNVNKALQEAGPSWLTASPTAPGVLAPGGSAPITVNVNPAGLAAGRWTGIVKVATDDPAHPELPISVTADISGCRSLAVEPGAIDFGSRLVGTVASADLTLRNDCNDTVTVAAVSSDDPAFALASTFPLKVPAFKAVTVPVEFHPAAAGPVSAILSFATDADADPIKTVALSGTGVEPPVATVNPDHVERTLLAGSSAVLDFEVGNSGGSDLTWALSGASQGFVPPEPYDASHFAPLDRGQPDPRVGRPVTRAAGGPDAFGYRWIDSDQPGGPAYQWQDIQSTGTPVLQGCLDCNVIRPLSFAFPFYGSSFSQVNITSKGWVNFGAASYQWSNYPLPSTSMPNYLVAAFFDDLTTATGGVVYFQDFGDRAVIQWNKVAFLSGTGELTFQIVLHSDGEIDYYYETMTGSVLSATTGIQNGDATAGLQIQYNTAYVKNHLAVRIRALPDWLRISEVSGTVPAGGSRHLALTLDAMGLTPGSYSQTMTLSHNNPMQPSLDIPVTLTVIGVPGGSRVLRVGPSAQAAAAGSRCFMWNMTVGGETRGLLQGDRHVLYLK